MRYVDPEPKTRALVSDVSSNFRWLLGQVQSTEGVVPDLTGRTPIHLCARSAPA